MPRAKVAQSSIHSTGPIPVMHQEHSGIQQTSVLKPVCDLYSAGLASSPGHILAGAVPWIKRTLHKTTPFFGVYRKLLLLRSTTTCNPSIRSRQPSNRPASSSPGRILAEAVPWIKSTLLKSTPFWRLPQTFTPSQHQYLYASFITVVSWLIDYKDYEENSVPARPDRLFPVRYGTSPRIAWSRSTRIRSLNELSDYR